jgi:hypothetical protein
MTKQKQLMVALAVVAILLAVIIIVIVQSSPPGSTVPTGAPGTTATSTEQSATPSTGSMGADGSAVAANGQEVPFDESTAVKVPPESTPRAWVEEYYRACEESQWELAWQHLPATKQQVTSPEALKVQLEGYGITGYKITNEQESGNALEISADQETANYGTFTSIWEFVKSAEGEWLVKNKAVASMN